MRVLVGKRDGHMTLRLEGAAGAWVNKEVDADGGIGDLVIFAADGGTTTIAAGDWDRALLSKEPPDLEPTPGAQEEK